MVIQSVNQREYVIDHRRIWFLPSDVVRKYHLVSSARAVPATSVVLTGVGEGAAETGAILNVKIKAAKQEIKNFFPIYYSPSMRIRS